MTSEIKVDPATFRRETFLTAQALYRAAATAKPNRPWAKIVPELLGKCGREPRLAALICDGLADYLERVERDTPDAIPTNLRTRDFLGHNARFLRSLARDAWRAWADSEFEPNAAKALRAHIDLAEAQGTKFVVFSAVSR